MASELAYDDDRPDRVARRREGGRSLARRQAGFEEALGRYDGELDRLSEILAPILGPERPSPALGGPGSPEEPASDLGRALEHYTDRLQQLTGRLAYLTDRIDL